VRDKQFREWLGRRSYQGRQITQKGINSRVRKAPRIERALKELGFEETDLDTVHANGRWPELVDAVRKVAAAWRSNEAAARKMAPQAPDPTRQLTNLINVARQYGHFADGEDPNYDTDADAETVESDEVDEAALEALRDRFLSKFPDFEAGGGFAGRSTYHAEEDDYKRPLISKVQALLANQLSPRSLGSELLTLLLDDNSMNLIGDYRRKNHLKDVRARSNGAFEEAIGELVLSDLEPPQAAAAFVDRAWPLVLEGSEDSKPYSDIRVLATLPQALARPDLAISVVTRRFENLSQALLSRSLFANDVLTAFEHQAALQLSAEVFSALEDWGWNPRDLWDVQGFVWVTCEEKLQMDGGSEDGIGQSDRIRKYALEHYIQPAREQGATSVSIRVGELHNALGLRQAHPNVCSSLRGQKFLSLAGVPAPAYTGPDTSSSTVLIFTLRGQPNRTRASNGPTNLILYGPPGTGKTYATAAEAVRLCDEPVPDDREELMAVYQSLQQKRRIGFVTFHQNFSYEDFIEGLRPVTASQEEETGGNAGFSLQPQDGIFKLIADLAASNRGKPAAGKTPAIDRNRKIFKMSLGRSWASEDDAIYQDAISGGYVVLGWGGDVNWSDASYDAWEAIKERWRQDHPDATGNDPNMSQMYTFRINMQIGSLVVISDGNRKFRAVGEITGPYQFVPGPNGEYNHRRSVHWLWHTDESLPRELIYGKELSQVSAYQMDTRQVNWDGLEQIVTGGDAATTSGEPQPFVLIIDEINRANISKVCGELISLLEPDKRLGQQNALTVRLPYSKQEFGVPANLHIVGTMNTADRSIALLDTALRRRFVFREMAPDPSLLPENVDDVPLRRVLETINERIEYLIDREHRIGHAFFIACQSRADVDAVMRDKIIPLLQEYFFEDWGRVAAVLGERGNTGGAFLDGRKLRDPTGNLGEERVSWNVRLDEHGEPDFAADAYDKLIGKAPAAEAAADSQV
jgi:hypothetical protein